MDTKVRVLDAAISSFGRFGYDGTSLDALAGELGVRKQTILYHYPSKDQLFAAAVDRAAVDLVGALEASVANSDPGWQRIEAVVRSVFRLALRRPDLLGLLREVTRPGSASADRFRTHADPVIDRARRYLEGEMASGRMRQTDARLVLASAYSTVVGAATEVEVLKAVGIEPDLRSMVRRRRELIGFLRSALLA